MNSKTITNFLNEEYKDYAMYVIEGRSIPSVIDGFKPTQRKVIHVSSDVWKTGNEKVKKIFQLAGVVADQAYYHHGNASLENTIISMAQKFKNNAPLLMDIGQFGSLRSPHAGAPRYIETKLSTNFNLIYKDFELLDYKVEEGVKIEPKYFLPIIPMVLVNGTSGIAVGFASNILNRGVRDVCDACIKILQGKKVKNITPMLNEFNGSFSECVDNNKKWIIRGSFNKVNTTTIRITELPPTITYEKYENILDKLIEDKKIVSYEDNRKNNIDYTIKMSRSSLDKMSDEDIIKLFKLEESSTENFSTLDENGKLLLFNSTADIVEYFVNFRLGYYVKRKEYILSRYERELLIIENKIKFIESIINNKLKVNNVEKSKIIESIEKLQLDKIDNSYDYLLRMPIYSLTKEMIEKLRNDGILKNKDINDLIIIEPKDMYLSDLSELKKKFKG